MPARSRLLMYLAAHLEDLAEEIHAAAQRRAWRVDDRSVSADQKLQLVAAVATAVLTVARILRSR